MAQIAKLEIKRGDILLVRSMEVLEQLTKTPAEFQVPLIFDPQGLGITKLNRQQLLDVLDQLDLIDEQNAKAS